MNSVKIDFIDEDILIYISGKDKQRLNKIKDELMMRENTEKKIINKYIDNGFIYIGKKALYFQVNINNRNYRGIKRNMTGISVLLKNHNIDINCDYGRFKKFMLKDKPHTRENILKYASLLKYKSTLQKYITDCCYIEV